VKEPLTVVVTDALPDPVTVYVYAGTEARLWAPPPTMLAEGNFR
jgi:hypothetical protein